MDASILQTIIEETKKLTPDQMETYNEYIAEFSNLLASNEPCDRPRATEAMKRHYKHLGKSVPSTFIFVRSPAEAQVVGNELIHNDDDEKKLHAWTAEGNDAWVAGIVSEAVANGKKNHRMLATHSFGVNDNIWVAHYRAMLDIFELEPDPIAEEGRSVMEELAHSSGFHYLFDKCAIICDRPSSVEYGFDGEVSMLVFSDGFKIAPEVLSAIACDEDEIIADIDWFG